MQAWSAQQCSPNLYKRGAGGRQETRRERGEGGEERRGEERRGKERKGKERKGKEKRETLVIRADDAFLFVWIDTLSKKKKKKNKASPRRSSRSRRGRLSPASVRTLPSSIDPIRLRLADHVPEREQASICLVVGARERARAGLRSPHPVRVEVCAYMSPVGFRVDSKGGCIYTSERSFLFFLKKKKERESEQVGIIVNTAGSGTCLLALGDEGWLCSASTQQP